MSIQAKLYIEDEEYTVLNFDFDFQKNADVNGRPTTKFKSGLFNFTTESNKKMEGDQFGYGEYRRDSYWLGRG